MITKERISAATEKDISSDMMLGEEICADGTVINTVAESGFYETVVFEDNDRVFHKKPVYNFFKRFADIVLSAIGIVALSPVFLAVIIVIMINDFGNPFYLQKRIGKNGKDILIFKFRSMKKGADKLSMLSKEQIEQYNREFKLDNDPRLIKAGNFLRKTSLDELPQLVNILKGDLSIVGPRPVLKAETMLYGENRDLFLSVKPGLTGYWQAYARNNATYRTGQRQRMELHYAKNYSFLFDIKIIFKTVETVIKKSGAK